MPWISVAPGHPSNMRPLRNDRADLLGPDAYAEYIRCLRDGRPIAVEESPQLIYAAPHAKETDLRFPNLFNGYGFWVVSQPAADILQKFDLGHGGLQPVSVAMADRITPVEGRWFILDIGNLKTALVASQSKSLYEFPGERWIVNPPLHNDAVVVSELAADGPDIWIDPQIVDAFFISDRLTKELKRARVDKGFMLSRCRVGA